VEMVNNPNMLYTTNILRNSSFSLILLVTLFYQKDESFNDDKIIYKDRTDLMENYQEESLKNRINIGVAKERLMRLQQSTSDIRQL